MPKIGLLSDSHGRAATTARAVEVLIDAGADLLLHLGDIGSVEVIDALAVEGVTDRPVTSRLVFGNTDWDLDGLAQYAQDLGVAVDDPVGTVELGQGLGSLVYCHGHERGPMNQAIRDQARYLCHGHSHRVEDYRSQQTRVVNPGALFRADRYTVALLDPVADRLEVLEVPG